MPVGDRIRLPPPVPARDLAWISESEMVEIDRIMIEDLHIELLQMMENAGRSLARLVLDLYAPKRVAVYAGSGGNGGGGLVAARHLHNAGVEVVITTTRPASHLSQAATHQRDILRRIGVTEQALPVEADVSIDALIGYSLRGSPHGITADMINHLRASRGPVVSLDTPSGIDVNTGTAPGIAVRADVTMTLALPKHGLRNAPEVGRLYLADISVPPELSARYGPAPDFSSANVLEIVERFH